MIKKTLILSAILLSGCASQQSLEKDSFELKNNEILFNELEKIKQQEESYEEINIKVVEFIEEEKLKMKTIKFDFTQGKGTIKDLMDVLEFYGISVMLAEDVEQEKEIMINKWNGSLRALGEAIGNNTNLSVRQKEGLVYIEKEKTYKLKVVQDNEIFEMVKGELEKLEGRVKELVVSDRAGVVSFKSDYKTFLKIKEVVKELNENMSLIKMDLSLVNVELSENTGNGFDWSSLNAAANLSSDTLLDSGFSLSNGNKLSINGNNFSVSMVMNVLNTYGQSEMVQNTSIRTLSGKEATFKTVEKTPYIDKVEVTENGDFSKTGFTTAETETGLEIKVLAYFDKESKMVNAKIDLSKSNLKGFLTIINDDSEIKSPQTEEQNYSSVIRLKAGETSVIGGIVFYKEKRNGNNIIHEITQSNTNELTKNALFIILRPTVKAYVYK